MFHRSSYRDAGCLQAARFNHAEDMRAIRAKVAGGIHPMAAKSLERVRARIDRETADKRPVLTAAGAYDPRAIMVLANAKAREMRTHGDQRPWSELIAVALRSAWLKAKLARSAALH